MFTRDDDLRDRPIRRIRVDGFAKARPIEAQGPAPTRSGRHVVLALGLALLVVCGLLSMVFHDWRTRYQKRAEFGAREVAPAIDPLADFVPQDVDPLIWQQAVSDTHAMLVTLTGSNLLDLAGMKALRAEIVTRVTRVRAHPETARDELADLWNDLTDRAEPVIQPRHPRPSLLPPRPQKDPRRLRAPAVNKS